MTPVEGTAEIVAEGTIAVLGDTRSAIEKETEADWGVTNVADMCCIVGPVDSGTVNEAITGDGVTPLVKALKPITEPAEDTNAGVDMIIVVVEEILKVLVELVTGIDVVVG